MRDLVNRFFLPSAGVALTLTGLAKALSATGPAHALDVHDPICGIAFRHLLLTVGIVELVIATLCLFANRRLISVLAIAWLSTGFLSYRIGLWFIGWHRQCGCLGTLTDVLGVSPEAADTFMKLVLACLLVGSYTLLYWHWRNAQRRDEGNGSTSSDSASIC